jgi:hypothetical protein
VADWTELGVSDEPWGLVGRRIDQRLAGRPVLLVDIPLNPAAYFYLHQLKTAVPVEKIDLENVAERMKRNPRAIAISRIEWADRMHALGWSSRSCSNSLVVWERS